MPKSRGPEGPLARGTGILRTTEWAGLSPSWVAASPRRGSFPGKEPRPQPQVEPRASPGAGGRARRSAPLSPPPSPLVSFLGICALALIRVQSPPLPGTPPSSRAWRPAQSQLNRPLGGPSAARSPGAYLLGGLPVTWSLFLRSSFYSYRDPYGHFLIGDPLLLPDWPSSCPGSNRPTLAFLKLKPRPGRFPGSLRTRPGPEEAVACPASEPALGTESFPRSASSASLKSWQGPCDDSGPTRWPRVAPNSCWLASNLSHSLSFVT